jgi:hypothetical protein
LRISHSSLPSKSRKRRTQLDLALTGLVIPLGLLLPELLNPDLSLIDDILGTLLAQILAETAVLASTSVLDLGKWVFGLPIQISFLFTLSMRCTIQLTDELGVQGNHLWFQFVEKTLDFAFLSLLGVLVEQHLERIGVGFSGTGDDYRGETFVVRDAEDIFVRAPANAFDTLNRSRQIVVWVPQPTAVRFVSEMETEEPGERRK